MVINSKLWRFYHHSINVHLAVLEQVNDAHSLVVGESTVFNGSISLLSPTVFVH